MFRQTVTAGSGLRRVHTLQWRAEHMFRQTAAQVASALLDLALQWRAEHMFRQTMPTTRRRVARRRGFNGGRNICSAKPMRRLPMSQPEPSFNGGRNICSAKP